MIDPKCVPPVADNELLARFILYRNETRADGTVKPKLFLPYSRVVLSVNRHRDATEEETWGVGASVAAERGRTLYGQANVRASSCRVEPLDVEAKPLIPSNPNHADITGYPKPKADQMSLATKLAASVEGSWIPAPSESDSGS